MESSFPLAPLEQIAELSGGFAFKSSDYRDGGRFVLRSLNILDDGTIDHSNAVYLPEERDAEFSRFLLQPHDTLFVMVGGSLGKIGYVRESDLPALLNQNMWLIRARAGTDPRFLHYAFRIAAKSGLGWASGSARDFVRRSDYRSLPIPLPPLADQVAVADVLSSLDDKIQINKRMSATLEAMVRALFKSWFVDFDPVRAKAEGRDTCLPPEIAALFPDSFESSELGEITRGWGSRRISEVAELTKGKSYRSTDLRESDSALVTLKSFARGGGYRPEGLKAYAGDYKPSQVVKPGDLIVACTDVTQAAEVVGRAALVLPDDSYRTLIASLDVLIVRPLKTATALSIQFLYCLFQTERYIDHAYAHTTGTTVLHLSGQALPSYIFAMPPAPILDAFKRVAEPLFNRSLMASEETKTLSRLRNALLPKLISGEIRLPDADHIVAKSA